MLTSAVKGHIHRHMQSRTKDFWAPFCLSIEMQPKIMGSLYKVAPLSIEFFGLPLGYRFQYTQSLSLRPKKYVFLTKLSFPNLNLAPSERIGQPRKRNNKQPIRDQLTNKRIESLFPTGLPWATFKRNLGYILQGAHIFGLHFYRNTKGSPKIYCLSPIKSMQSQNGDNDLFEVHRTSLLVHFMLP